MGYFLLKNIFLLTIIILYLNSNIKTGSFINHFSTTEEFITTSTNANDESNLFKLPKPKILRQLYGQFNDTTNSNIEASCNAIDECINCNVYRIKNSHCSWSLNRGCQQSFDKPSPIWWNTFSNCLNEKQTVDKMKLYCGGSGEPAVFIPTKLALPKVDYKYASSNLYCKWEFINNEPKHLIIFNFRSFTNIEKSSIISFQINYENGQKLLRNLDRDFMIWDSNGITSFEIHFYTLVDFNLNPFWIDMDYIEAEKSNNYIGVIISLCTVLLTCILCGFCFYKFSKVMTQNAIRRAAASRADFQNNIMNIQAQSNSERVDQNVMLLKQKNKEILDKMLNSQLKPIKYTENLNEFKASCTICIDNFLENNSVIVLSCKHIFHYNCLKCWLEKNLLNPKCPNCNDIVITKELPNEEVKLSNDVSDFEMHSQRIINSNTSRLERSENIENREEVGNRQISFNNNINNMN